MFIRLTPALVGAAALVTGLSAAPALWAQSISSSSASFNAGYGRVAGQENRAVSNFGMRDENGNLAIVDGALQGGPSGGVNASSQSSGSASASATAGAFGGGVGRGFASATAIGNNLTVVTQGNYNTVIVNSTQINNGNVTANSSADGGASNDP